MKRTNKKGFTIVELVIVIAVIAILAAVLIPNISRLVKKANESSDIQAVRNMNTFLAAEGATGDIKSILDVYDLFVDSGYNVDSYSPLYSGRHFYYDKQYNQILYVETESGKVLFPEERKNDNITTTLKNHNLFSLSMEVPTLEEVAIDSTTIPNTMKATVTNAGQFAYVVDEYNKTSGKSLELTIDGTIDMMGAQCLIETAKGDITIQGKGGETGIIKNITANKSVSVSDVNTQKVSANYGCAVLIGQVAEKTVIIKNITIENANIKNVDTGNVAFLIGEAGKHDATNETNVTIENVTIKDSTVIAHRSVGSFIGYAAKKTNVTIKGSNTIENVNVQTIGGRSALVIGLISNNASVTIASGATVRTEKSELSIYKNAESKQEFADGKTAEKPEKWEDSAWNSRYGIKDQDQYIYSCKLDSENSMVVYGFKTGALFLQDVGGGDPSQSVISYTTVVSIPAKE